MKLRTKRKLRAGARAILNVLDKNLDWMFIPSRSETVRRLKSSQFVSLAGEFEREFYASSVRDGVGRLLRQGKVEVRDAAGGGQEVRITDRGRTEILKYKLADLKLNKQFRWDKKWRLVMFDVAEVERGRRDVLRKWLAKLGLKRLQMSVWIYPYPLESEIKFLREILGVPHGVKVILAEEVENYAELREMFDL